MSELKRQESLLDEATVLEYLARYPEFFQRHGAMLDRIRIPHEHNFRMDQPSYERTQTAGITGG